MLSENELKKLHSDDYVKGFETSKSKFRLERLSHLLDLNSSHNVVDFACGSGIMLPLVGNKVNSYTGVDFSEDFISLAKSNASKLSISNANFECKDILEFCSLNKESFDVAFAMDFSEHVYDDQWQKLLAAIRNSLKPGGKIYLHTPNAEFFLEKMKAKNFIVKQFPQDIAVRSPQENCDMLERCGFKIRVIKLIPHYNI